MKKPSKNGVTAAKVIAGIAATLTLGCNVNGCVYGPAPILDNLNGDVYGPPPTSTTEETQDIEKPEITYQTDDNENEDVYGPPDGFDHKVDLNENEDVYGPPEDMG